MREDRVLLEELCQILDLDASRVEDITVHFLNPLRDLSWEEQLKYGDELLRDYKPVPYGVTIWTRIGPFLKEDMRGLNADESEKVRAAMIRAGLLSD